MAANPPMPASQRVVQVCLFLLAAIAVFGSALQMYRWSSGDRSAGQDAGQEVRQFGVL